MSITSKESLPERIEIKRSFYKTLDELASSTTVIGSSTSGLPASSFTEGLRNAARCLVVHPINPPHLIPLVEIIPAPWTDASAVERAVELMRNVGQSPVTLTPFHLSVLASVQLCTGALQRCGLDPAAQLREARRELTARCRKTGRQSLLFHLFRKALLVTGFSSGDRIRI